MIRLRSALVALGALIIALTALGPWSGTTPSASAATGDASAAVAFSCKIGDFPAYAWNPTVTVSAVRPAGSATVTVTGHTTDMAGASPVPLDYEATTSMKLDLSGTALTTTGSGRVKTTAPYATFAVPDTTGTFVSSAADVVVTVSSFGFVVDPNGLKMSGTCTPTGSSALGTMTIVMGTVPTPTPTPTTITSATAKPTATPTATESTGDDTGTPARGKVTFTCVLNPLGSKFSYPATITVAGYRTDPADDVTLSATMTNLPGIAPVPIDGTMNVALGLTVGGTKTTLTGTSHVTAAPKQSVAVPTLTGKVAADGNELKVLAQSFTFDFPDMSIDAACTASATVGTLVVGTEAASSGVSDGSSGTLPATGANHLAAMLAWAAGLVALGAAGLVMLRRTAR